MGRGGAGLGGHRIAKSASVCLLSLAFFFFFLTLSLSYMPPALFLLALYPFYFTLVLGALLAGVKQVLVVTSSPTAVVRGLVC